MLGAAMVTTIRTLWERCKNKSQIATQFGSAVRKRRLRLGLSQEDLANLSGLHRTYISSVERGQRNVSLVNIERLAESLGVDIQTLFKEV